MQPKKCLAKIVAQTFEYNHNHPIMFFTKLKMCGMSYTLEYHAFIVEHYFQTETYKTVQMWFEKKFLGIVQPNKSTIKAIIGRFQQYYKLAIHYS